jgi:hypothetical protein
VGGTTIALVSRFNFAAVPEDKYYRQTPHIYGGTVMAKYTFVVLTNPTPGKEAEYNKWYNEQHIPDVLNVPGFVAAQRFRLADAQMGDKNPHRYLALYEIETDDLPTALKELKARSGSAEMVMSDAIDLKDVGAFVFAPVAEKVQAKDVQRSRRAA